MGRNESLVERGRGQGIVVEGREETGQMAYVVDGCLVIEDGILCRRTATHLKAAGSIALGLDTRQQLYGAHDVGLAEKCRLRGEFLHLYLFSTYLDGTQSALGCIGIDNDFLKLLLTNLRRVLGSCRQREHRQ